MWTSAGARRDPRLKYIIKFGYSVRAGFAGAPSSSTSCRRMVTSHGGVKRRLNSTKVTGLQTARGASLLQEVLDDAIQLFGKPLIFKVKSSRTIVENVSGADIQPIRHWVRFANCSP